MAKPTASTIAVQAALEAHVLKREANAEQYAERVHDLRTRVDAELLARAKKRVEKMGLKNPDYEQVCVYFPLWPHRGFQLLDEVYEATVLFTGGSVTVDIKLPEKMRAKFNAEATALVATRSEPQIELRSMYIRDLIKADPDLRDGIIEMVAASLAKHTGRDA